MATKRLKRPRDPIALAEDREPGSRAVDLLHALQFRPHPSDHARYPGDGRWRVADALVNDGRGEDGRGMGAGAEAGYELMHRVYGICGITAGLVLIVPEAILLSWLRQGYV